jgi:hypothetical protein
MDYVNLFPHKNLSDQWQRVEEAEECAVTLHNWDVWQVVDLESVSHVSKSASVVLELVRDEDNLVTAFYEALSQLVTVSLNSSEFRESKVSAEQD